MLKASQITPELKQEIVKYALEVGYFKAQTKYHVWVDTIKYWIDPDFKEKLKNRAKYFHAIKMKTDPAYRENRRIKSVEIRKLPSHQTYALAYRKAHYDKLGTRSKQHRLDNLEHYKEQARINTIKRRPQLRLRYKNDPIYRLKCNLREALRRAFKYSQIEKNSPSIRYLGCTIEEFKTHIESKFLPGMNWENHGRGRACWHVDHKIPLDQLQKESGDLLPKLCHYTNLQPLWEIDNLRKNNKLILELVEDNIIY